MILYTSLSPSEKAIETQTACITSWIDHGHSVICVQGHGDKIHDLPVGAAVERVRPTAAGRQGRPYVGLDAILDSFLASGQEKCGIINGDIEISDPDGLLHGDTEDLLCIRRHDHSGDKSRAVVFSSGFDMFVLTRAHALSVPRSLFVIGQTFWDYWLPWSAARAGHTLGTINTPIIYHQRHALNYAHHDWLRTVHHFCWLTNRANMSQPQRISGEVHAHLNKLLQSK